MRIPAPLLSILSMFVVSLVTGGCGPAPGAKEPTAPVEVAGAAPTSRAVSHAAEPAQAESGEVPQVIGEIEKIGGRVARDSSGAVTGVDLSEARPKDFDFTLLSKLPALVRLELYGAEVTDRALEAVGALKLRELVLENTEITDKGVPQLARLTTLKSLNLRRSSYLTDASLASLDKLTGLEQLHLLYNNFGNAGMESVAKLPKLRVLDLRGCVMITDDGIAKLAALKNLERLKLRNPNVSDAGLHAIRDMTKLKGLGLEDTQVTDDGLADVEGLA
ncbi:MAG TPA: hypothetical protein VHV08_14615, partial [Pirellulales bacterium]|nr:hypothetical protein [Pirellulales bacterium]